MNFHNDEVEINFKPELHTDQLVLVYPDISQNELYRQSNLYNGDAKRLYAPNKLNDSIVDYSLSRFIIETEQTDIAFNFDPILVSLLRKYQLLSPLERYDKVRKLTGGHFIFKRKYLLFPVNVDNIHWYSLIVLEPANVFKRNVILTEHSSCILVLDSLCGRKTIEDYEHDISNVKDYLVMEWLFKSCTVTQRTDIQKSYEQRISNFSVVRSVLLVTPQQPNDYDCGFYMIRNFKNALRFDLCSHASRNNDHFRNFLSESKYNHDDIEKDRVDVRIEVTTLIEEFLFLHVQNPFSSQNILEDIVNDHDVVFFDSETRKHIQIEQMFLSLNEVVIVLTPGILEIILSYLIGVDEGCDLQDNMEWRAFFKKQSVKCLTYMR